MKFAASELYGKPGLYRIFNQIPNKLKEKYGNTLCRKITEKCHETWLCREHALHCREIITDAAGISAELIFSGKEIVANLPFCENVENLKDDSPCKENT